MVCVWALCGEGRKGGLPLSTATRESSESWVEVRRDLVTRGRQTPVTLTTEGAPGLTNASEVSGPQARRLRGWVPQRPNLQPNVPPQAWPEFTALGADRRAAPAEAERRRQLSVTRSHRDFPQAWRGRLAAAAARLTHLSVPQRPQPYVRTSTRAERAGEEARRRTKGIPPLGDAGSVTKLGFAVLIRLSERWGKKGCSEFEPQQIRSLRRRRTLDEHEVRRPEATPESHSGRSAASAA